MGFRIVDDEWMEAQVLQVKAIFRLRLERGVEYTPVELQELLAANGLQYLQPEWNQVRGELVAQGVLEETV